MSNKTLSYNFHDYHRHYHNNNDYYYYHHHHHHDHHHYLPRSTGRAISFTQKQL